ncbi:N-acetylmuramoyl-L-alanine amidase [compost metagenome]
MYNNFEEAIEQHAKVLLKSYYTKAMDQYDKDKDPKAFATNITGIYATDPNYDDKLISIMNTYNLA